MSGRAVLTPHNDHPSTNHPHAAACIPELCPHLSENPNAASTSLSRKLETIPSPLSLSAGTRARSRRCPSNYPRGLRVDSIPIACRVRRKRGPLPSNVSIRSDPAVPIPPPPALPRRITPDRVIACIAGNSVNVLHSARVGPLYDIAVYLPKSRRHAASEPIGKRHATGWE